MKKLFTHFAVEPTFYFDTSTIKIPEFLKSSLCLDDLLDDASEALEDLFKEKKIRKKHPWFKKAYEDGDSLEIPSTVYSNKNVFLKTYQKLVFILRTEYQFIPSSLVCMETEGGCHLNVSIPNEVYNSPLAKQFFNNLQSYLTNNPSIIWSFLAPTDNESSVVPFKNDPRQNSKGEFFTIRQNDGNGLSTSWYGERSYDGTPMYYGDDVTIDRRNSRVYLSYKKARRIELRFFMQPPTMAEMKLEVEFGLHLLNWIWQQTVRGKEWKQMNSSKDLREYTSKKALSEISSVCRELEFPYERLEQAGRIKNLKTKFEYLPKYLV